LIGWGHTLVRLGERSFWADEGATVVQARQISSLVTAAQLHKEYHFFHLVLEMGLIRLSESEFILRLPSAMAITLTVPVLYALGRRLFSRAAGLVSAFLLVISPFALGYAQEARAYALLALLATLSLLLLLMALARQKWSWWIAYALTTSMLLYTHFFALFVVAAEVLFVLICVGMASAPTKQRGATWRAFCKGLDSWPGGGRPLLMLAISLLAIVVLYQPLTPALLQFLQDHGPGSASLQGAGLYPFRLSLNFFQGLLISFGPRSGGWPQWLYGLALVLGVIGLFLRRNWPALLVAGLWLGVPLLGLSIASSNHFFDYRYLIFVLPIFLLVVAEGTGFVAAAAGTWVGWPRAQPWLALGLACLLLFPANLPALRIYHRSEKENWRDIARFVQATVQGDEAIYVSPQFWANPLLFYAPALEANVVGGTNGSKDNLAQAAKEHPGVWYMRHVAPIGDPKGVLTSWVLDQKFDLLIDGHTCGLGISVYYRRSDATAQSRRSELIRRASELCPHDPRFRALTK
jgi:hypothetical protein